MSRQLYPISTATAPNLESHTPLYPLSPSPPLPLPPSTFLFFFLILLPFPLVLFVLFLTAAAVVVQYLMEDEFDLDNVEAFIDDFLAGNLKPHIKSEPVPK